MTVRCDWCGTSHDGRTLKKIGTRSETNDLEWNNVCRNCYEQEMGNRDVDLKIYEELMRTRPELSENERDMELDRIVFGMSAIRGSL